MDWPSRARRRAALLTLVCPVLAFAEEPSEAPAAAPSTFAASEPSALPAPPARKPDARRADFGLPERDFQALLEERPRGEWIVRQLKGDPAVVVIQFPSLQVQGLTLNRVAALIEKTGASRTHVLTDPELERLIRDSGDTSATFYLGHDYTAPDLARFFNAANAQRVALNAEEQGLRSLLEQIGMLVPDGRGGHTAPRVAALVTFGALQAADAQVPDDEAMDPVRRASVLGHELSHGVYFTRAAYRNYCHRFWDEQLTGPERATWRRYLRGLGYDGTNEDLLVNEMQALLMHTSDRRDFNAAALGVGDAELEGMRNRFIMRAAESAK